MRLACLGQDLARTVNHGPQSSRCERLVLEERPHRACCGISRMELVWRFVMPTVQARTVG